MKSLIFFVVVLQAIPLAISANPVGFPRQQQQQQNIAISPPSSVNSFSTSSDVESGSDSDNPSRKSSFFNAFKKLNPSSSSGFRCYSYPTTHILSDLSLYITNLVRMYRDNIFEGNEDQERKLFETCYAGYDATNVSPAIYFRQMKAKQMKRVHQLLQNQVPTVFPNVRVMKTSNALAIVWEERPMLHRRVTI